MLTIARRAALNRTRAVSFVAVRNLHGPGTTPDTGGPLFSTQFGVPIHKPQGGGDKARKAAESNVPKEKKPETKAHKVQGGYSFAELRRLHQDGRD